MSDHRDCSCPPSRHDRSWLPKPPGRDEGQDQVSQYLVHPALRPRLDAWLESQGFRVDRLPADVEGEGQLPTYLVAPAEWPDDAQA